MAERALVAVAHEGGYDCYYAPDPPDDDGRECTAEPRFRVRSLSAVAARLNYAEFERVRALDGEAADYLPVWSGPPDPDVPGARPPEGDGALVPVPEVGTDAARECRVTYTRGWFEGAKSATWDAAVAGLLPPAGARSYLAARVREYAPGAVVGTPSGRRVP